MKVSSGLHRVEPLKINGKCDSLIIIVELVKFGDFLYIGGCKEWEVNGEDIFEKNQLSPSHPGKLMGADNILAGPVVGACIHVYTQWQNGQVESQVYSSKPVPGEPQWGGVFESPESFGGLIAPQCAWQTFITRKVLVENSRSCRGDSLQTESEVWG